MLDVFEGLLSTKKVLPKHAWMATKRFVLVTPENLVECIEACINGVKGRFSLDLETTGLDNRVYNGETKDKIVGVCLSGDGVTGWYIPLRHKKGAEHNVPFMTFDSEFRRLMAAVDEGKVKALFHNGKFDQEFLEFNGNEPYGNWDAPKNWEDTLILAYLRNSRARRKSLKVLSEASNDEPSQEQIALVGGRGLGMKMYELEDLFPEDHPKNQYDFSLLDPSEEGPLIYGCSDGICTWLLADLLLDDVLKPKKHPYNQGVVYIIEKLCVAATRWMERNGIQTDPEKVMALIKLGQQEWHDSVMDVYRSASEILGRDIMPGYYKLLLYGSPEDGITYKFVSDDPLNLLAQQVQTAKNRENRYFPNPVGFVTSRGKRWPLIYDVNAPAQLGQMFEEMGVPGLIYTEKSQQNVDKSKWQVKTAKDVLERIIDEAEDKFPFMKLIKRFRETNKALSSYLYPMLEYSDPDDYTMRVGFVAHKVDTGRFSTPAKERELGVANKSQLPGWPEINFQSMPATYDPKRPACMTRLRECIVAREGYYIVAIDYSGEELRLVTNLSGEAKWLDEFFHCSSCDRKFSRGDGASTPPPPPARCPNCGSDKIGDLHTLTALGVYGQDAPTRDNWKALRGYAKCVHPDTLVGLFEGGTHAGIRPLHVLTFGADDHFLPVRRMTSVWDGQQDIPVQSTYNGGVRHLFHVVTRRGILTCSDQHAFLRSDGSLASLSLGLAVGDMLAEPNNAPYLNPPIWTRLKYRPFEGVPEVEVQTTPDMAYFAGLFLGDGSKGGTTTIGIAHGLIGKIDKTGTTYNQWQDLLVAALHAVGFAPRRLPKSVYMGSRHVMRFLETLDLVDGVAGGRTLRVPLWVLQAGSEGVLQFLGGLFDTDGTVNKIDAGISWTTKDAVFAGQIAALVHALGVTPAVEPSWNKTYGRWYYRVNVRASDALQVAKYMQHPGKRSRLRETSSGSRYPNKVLAIIPAGNMPCVDISLDTKEHIYWTNGLLTHNSTNFALCYGGGGNAVVRATGCDKNEGWRIKTQFDATYLGLKRWWAGQHRFAKEYGFVLTAFGRIYPVPDIWSADGGFRSKAERNSVNGPIQGCQVYEARVWTDKGAIQIGDLWARYGMESDRFKVWTGTTWSPARALYSGSKQKVITTFTSGNQARTSPDHRFLVYKAGLEWVRQDDLVVGDWVLQDAVGIDVPPPVYSCETPTGASQYNSKGFSFHGNSQVLWEFLGLVYGDGSIRRDHFIIHVGGDDAEKQAQFYCDRVNTLGVMAHIRQQKRGTKEAHKKSMWQVVIHNKAFRDFCRDTLGVEDANTWTKTFPAQVWAESASNRAAFLRGYFSADGCVNIANAVDVRSTNPDLLMDTHKLLRSIGIRSTVRLDSKRVSIKDRVAYRDQVGFLIPKKSERLSAIEGNPWTGQWHALPQVLIKQVGEAVYNSSIYADLPRDEKSDVLRLKAGSGSKPQCLRYLDKVPPVEVPVLITSLLGFDYEQVVDVEDTGVQVEMYDIEVGDCVHAFVCDGVIVHNSGADIIKLAMGSVYKECKKRGWLDHVRLIATMHDELVFEVHGSLLEEAIAVITPIMTSNTMIMGMRWPVPLTADCEMGRNWAVSWDLNAMRYREVRFDGNKKIKEPQKPRREDFMDDDEGYQKALDAYPAKKAAWVAMPHSWPEELRDLFRSDAALNAAPVPNTPLPVAVAELPAHVKAEPEAHITVGGVSEGDVTGEVAPLIAASAPPEAPRQTEPTGALKSGDTYDFILGGDLTPKMCASLADVISHCQNGGTKKLRIKLSDGTVLTGWSDVDYYVIPNEFYYLAKARGLLGG